MDAISRRGVRSSDEHVTIGGGRSVVQQPSAWNGYIAIIRINDRRSGAAYDDVAAFWE